MKMASSSNSRSLKDKTDYSTRSQSVVDRMDDIYNTFNANNTVSDFTIIHELWPRFSTISPVNFNSISPPQPCILAGVNVQPRGILKQLSDKPGLVWADFGNIPNYPLFNITKGPEYSVTREFINSMQGDMDFANCLTSFSFLDQIVTSCIGLLVQGPWFSYAHIEVGGGASYALLHTGIKIWCATTTNSSSRLLERCCNNANNFIDFVQRGPRDKEANYLRFTIQRPGDLIYVPSLRPHAVLTLDTGKPTILSGWDASTIADSTIITRTLDEYIVGVRRGTWRKILRTQGREALRNWVFTPAVGPQASKEKLRKHWTYWETYCPHLLSNLSV